MSYLTRPSNVRVYQFRQPPGCEPVDFTARFIRHSVGAIVPVASSKLKLRAIGGLNPANGLINFAGQ
jgi:hypothetical protein